MKVDTHSLSATRTVLSVVSEKPDTDAIRAAVVAEYAKSAALPGFRKGKAPAAAVERAYGSRIRRDTIDRAIREGYEKAVEEKGLKVFEIVSIEPEPLAEDGTLVTPRYMRYVPAHARLFHASNTPLVSETTFVNAIGNGSKTAV